MNTTLSIVIPHYNDSQALIKLLESIPRTSDIQIIVVDDNSTELEFERIKHDYTSVEFYLNNSKKRGAGTCRNIGLEKAAGEWILFADSDDYFLEDFYSVISKYVNTDNDVVFFVPTSRIKGTVLESDRHESYERIVLNYLRHKDKKSELKLRYSYVVPWSKLFSRKFLLENDIWFDEIIAGNDIMFSTKSGHSLRSFEASSACIYCVIDRDDSLTKDMSKATYFSRLNAHIDRSNFLKEHISVEDYKTLRIGGRGFLKVAFRNKLGVTVILKTLYLLVKNRIPLVYFADFSVIIPIFQRTIK
jgi:glycosyltransferase involved in cell wall biosynthesis